MGEKIEDNIMMQEIIYKIIENIITYDPIKAIIRYMKNENDPPS